MFHPLAIGLLGAALVFPSDFSQAEQAVAHLGAPLAIDIAEPDLDVSAKVEDRGGVLILTLDLPDGSEGRISTSLPFDDGQRHQLVLREIDDSGNDMVVRAVRRGSVLHLLAERVPADSSELAAID